MDVTVGMISPLGVNPDILHDRYLECQHPKRHAALPVAANRWLINKALYQMRVPKEA